MEQKVRVLPAVSERIETGAICFGNDWPGLFIRGDNAFALSLILGEVLECLTATDSLPCPYLSELRYLKQEIDENVICGFLAEIDKMNLVLSNVSC